jgi:hypothetical protein
MPSESVASWACEFCAESHPVNDANGKRKAYCPRMGTVYSPEALKRYRKTAPRWWEQHEFVDTDKGVLCVECGKSYEDLEAEEQGRVAD